jgi:hypothetical protein
MVVALFTAVISVVFTLFVVDLYISKRRPYQLIWTIGLLCYALGAFAQFWGGVSGWNDGWYRLWYLTGAVCVAAYLGLGVVFLNNSGLVRWVVTGGVFLGSLPGLLGGAPAVGFLGLVASVVLAVTSIRFPQFFAGVATVLLVIGTALVSVVVWLSPMAAGSLPLEGAIATGKGFPAVVRLCTPLFNISGAGALVAGAASSAMKYARDRTKGDRARANVLILAGALVPSMGASLTRFGWPSLLYISELIGVVLIFAGFVKSAGTIRQLRIPLLRPRKSGRPRGASAESHV